MRRPSGEKVAEASTAGPFVSWTLLEPSSSMTQMWVVRRLRESKRMRRPSGLQPGRSSTEGLKVSWVSLRTVKKMGATAARAAADSVKAATSATAAA